MGLQGSGCQLGSEVEDDRGACCAKATVHYPRQAGSAAKETTREGTAQADDTDPLLLAQRTGQVLLFGLAQHGGEVTPEQGASGVGGAQGEGALGQQQALVEPPAEQRCHALLLTIGFGCAAAHDATTTSSGRIAKSSAAVIHAAVARPT
jgi:hypothetical protein